MQLFLQLALLLLQPPLVLQEFALLHLQLPHLLLAGLVLFLQFCQSGQQCITLWAGQGGVVTPKVFSACVASRAFLCPPASTDSPGLPTLY